ncbi:MAG TPA: ShlB/FhaC/HecB family hemolysin secretion/activation protein, partial [Rhodocyclaceae bacterium]|nr:ShlB/FhaC/HecB family hemolysin secretion/activation protein [Rhodocyclaceae bacterium]
YLSSDGALQTLVADAIGRELDFAGLEQLTQRVTDHLKASGWLLARAYLPHQDITEGEIEIVLLAGQVDPSYRIVNGGKSALRIDPALLTGIASRALPPGSAARTENLERAVLLTNDLPGISAKSSLSPGSQADTTRIDLTIDEGPLFSGNLAVDNFGNRDTGQIQTNATGNLNDPFGQGDQATVLLTHADGLNLLRGAYNLSADTNGLKASAAWSSMAYRIIRGVGLASGLKGSSQTSTLSLAYPFIRQRSHNLNGNLATNRKALKDESSAGILKDKRIDNTTIALSGDASHSLGFSTWNIGYTGGNVDLARIAVDDAADTAGYRSAGRYTKLNYGASHTQPLATDLSLFVNFSAQIAAKNLDSSEKFSLGGSSGVRAYPGGEASGDSGQMLNLEARYDVPNPLNPLSVLGRLQVQAFYDTGRITLHRDAYDIPIPTHNAQNNYALSGWGLAASLMKTGSHNLRLVWAAKGGDNPGRATATGFDGDGRRDESRVWLQATIWF